MSKKINFSGTGVAIITPFKKDLSIDYKSLKNLIEDLIQGDVDFLVVLGTTGESVVLSKQEKEEIIDFVIKTNAGRLPLVLGIGGNNTSEVVEAVKNCPKAIDGILSVSPFYNKPSQEGIYLHFSAIAHATKKPIILYNVPGRTSSNVSPTTALRLAQDFNNVVAIKEAAGDLNQAMELIEHKPKGFLVLSGDDALTCPMCLMGGDGVISVQAMAAPKLFSDMVRLACKGKRSEAIKRHYAQLKMMDLIFEEGNPVGIKAVLKQRRIIKTDRVRLPLVDASKTLHGKLKIELNKIEA